MTTSTNIISLNLSYSNHSMDKWDGLTLSKTHVHAGEEQEDKQRLQLHAHGFLCRQKKVKVEQNRILQAETSPVSASNILSVDAIFSPNKSHLELWDRILKLIKKARVFQLCSTASSEPSASLFHPIASALSRWLVKASRGIFDKETHLLALRTS